MLGNYFEADVPPGLEALARQELQSTLRSAVFDFFTKHPAPPGVLQFHWHGDYQVFRTLGLSNAVFLVRRYPIPRPKALLGDRNYRQLLRQIQTVLVNSASEKPFQSLMISAAGRQSSVLRRLAASLSQSLNIELAEKEADLVLRLRRPLGGRDGWEVLVRTTSRPLSTRDWRVCNYPGALNAPVARAMALMTEPTPGDFFLNLACGSATILIERGMLGGFQGALGLDSSPPALACAVRNLAAASVRSPVNLLQGDGGLLPLAAGSVSAACADLPFGALVGSHRENRALYPSILAEAARVSLKGARFAVLTHEIRLMARTLINVPIWEVEAEYKINLRGLHPRIYLLRRS